MGQSGGWHSWTLGCVACPASLSQAIQRTTIPRTQLCHTICQPQYANHTAASRYHPSHRYHPKAHATNHATPPASSKPYSSMIGWFQNTDGNHDDKESFFLPTTQYYGAEHSMHKARRQDTCDFSLPDPLKPSAGAKSQLILSDDNDDNIDDNDDDDKDHLCGFCWVKRLVLACLCQ